MKYKTQTLLYVLILITVATFSNIDAVFAESVVLSWDPPTTNADSTPLTDLAGYSVYYGTESGNYAQSIDVGNVTSYQVNNLSTGVTYYFATTAYDTSGNESAYSAEVSKTFPASDTTAPAITSVQSSNLTATTAAISWTTDEASTTQVEYGTTPSYGSATTLDSTMVLSHSAGLSGLTASTVYHYRVISRDAAGNQSVSVDSTFTTAAPADTTAPAITSVQSSNLTTTTATISWTTDEASTTQVEYGTTPSYGSATALDSTMVLNHSAGLSGLTASTVYHYRVISRDAAGNQSVSVDSTFTTAASPVEVNYYCDSDNDGFAGASIDGTCSGAGCEPAGCQTFPGNDCNDTNNAINPAAADSICDGIDDNCDGIADNNYVPTETLCGEGVCAATGQLICSNGITVDTCSAGAPTGDDSDCDGIDDNCDGVADNNYVASVVSCGTGVCSSTGVLECQSGAEVSTCTPGSPAEQTETTCGDSLDNDCDGQVDEGCFPEIQISNVLLTEDFSGGIPVEWSAQGAWDSDNQCNRTIGYPFEGSLAMVDSACSSTGTDELVTPSIDAVSCTGLKLAFSNQYFWYSGSAEVSVSGDGGMTWSSALTMSSDDGYPSANWKEIDASIAAGSSDVKFRFRYVNSSSDGFWALDNVWVTCDSAGMVFTAPLQQTATGTAMISNVGTYNLDISTITISGQDASSFSIGLNDNCTSQTLLPDETCELDVLFAPLATGQNDAVLTVSSNDPGNASMNMALAGTGTEPPIEVTSETGLVTINKGEAAPIALALDTGSFSSESGDVWILMEYRKRWYYYDKYTRRWRRGMSHYDQGQISNFDQVMIHNTSKLPRGNYSLHFGVDTQLNGNRDENQYYSNSVMVNVQ